MNITVDRKVIEQALEALDYVMRHGPAVQKAKDILHTALEQPEQEPVAIEWRLDGDKSCGYNNWVGHTPFGRILITWKGWKKYNNACVDEFPGGFNAYGSPDEVKAKCEVEFARRLNTTPPQRKPLTEEEIGKLWDGHVVPVFGKNGINPIVFARAIEAAHGIKENT